MATRTLSRQSRRWPVRTLAARVISGPDAGRECHAEGAMLAIGTALGNELVLTDRTVSHYHVELRRTGEGIELVDPGSTNGTWIGPLRVQRGLLEPGTELQLGDTRLLINDGAQRTVALAADTRLGELVGASHVMRALFARVEHLADAEEPLLIQGEAGTGKTLVARTVHAVGRWQPDPLWEVDCASLPPESAQARLLGDAAPWCRAERGLLLLEQVGELPSATQAGLAQRLERGSAGLRVLASTSYDLRRRVNCDRFRPELYHRLAATALHLPPLRDRAADIPLLVEHLLARHGASDQLERLFPTSAMDELRRYDWPGNVRELEKLVTVALLSGRPAAPQGLASSPSPFETELPYKEARHQVVEAFERHYLRALLERAAGNVSQAARLAEMDRSHLIDLLARHRLAPQRGRRPSG